MGCVDSKEKEELTNPNLFQYFRHVQKPYEIWRDMKTHIKVCKSGECTKINEYECVNENQVSSYPQYVQIGYTTYGNPQFIITQRCQEAIKLNRQMLKDFEYFRNNQDKGQIKYQTPLVRHSSGNYNNNYNNKYDSNQQNRYSSSNRNTYTKIQQKPQQIIQYEETRRPIEDY